MNLGVVRLELGLGLGLGLGLRLGGCRYCSLREYGTVERSGSTNTLGYPLHSRWSRKVERVLSYLSWLEFDLRNRMASPLTKPLNTPFGWEEEKWRYWKVLVGLKNVSMSRIPDCWNLLPL